MRHVVATIVPTDRRNVNTNCGHDSFDTSVALLLLLVVLDVIIRAASVANAFSNNHHHDQHHFGYAHRATDDRWRSRCW